MKIHFSNTGKSLGTRSLGLKFRNQIDDALSNGEFIEFDFDGVNRVAHSFADECFAKLMDKWGLDNLKSRSTFKNLSPSVNRTILFTLNRRLVSEEVA